MTKIPRASSDRSASVGWVERSETHKQHFDYIKKYEFHCRSTHPTFRFLF